VGGSPRTRPLPPTRKRSSTRRCRSTTFSRSSRRTRSYSRSRRIQAGTSATMSTFSRSTGSSSAPRRRPRYEMRPKWMDSVLCSAAKLNGCLHGKLVALRALRPRAAVRGHSAGRASRVRPQAARDSVRVVSCSDPTHRVLTQPDNLQSRSDMFPLGGPQGRLRSNISHLRVVLAINYTISCNLQVGNHHSNRNHRLRRAPNHQVNRLLGTCSFPRLAEWRPQPGAANASQPHATARDLPAETRRSQP
jgi:hypothetical protein